MFSLGNFIKNGFLKAIGKMADYQIILNAAGWYEKGVLTEADLAEIQAKIDEKNANLEAVKEAEAYEDKSGAGWISLGNKYVIKL